MTSTPPRRPTAPKGLQRRGRAFWRRIVIEFEPSDVELELLREVCRLLDELEQLYAAVDVDGITVEGSQGQKRVHPALTEARNHRIALIKLLGELDFPEPIDVPATGAPHLAVAR